MFDRRDPSPFGNQGRGPNASGNGPRGRLAVLQLVQISLRSLALCRDDALRLGIVPVVIYFLGMIYGRGAVAQLFDSFEQGRSEIDAAAAGPLFLTGLIIVAGLSLLAVNWLRFLLLGPNAADGLGLSLRRAHVVFFGGAIGLGFCASLALSLLSIPITLLLGPVAQFGVWAAVLVIGMVAVRLALMLVAIAIGQPIGLRRAWEASQGQGWALLFACLLVEAPFVLLMLVVGLLAGSTGLSAAAPYTMLFIGCVAQIAATLAQCGVLAAAYRRLIGIQA